MLVYARWLEEVIKTTGEYIVGGGWPILPPRIL